MPSSRRPLFFIVCLALCAAGVAVFVWLRPHPARQPLASDRALYHPDPDHLWNRLHEALFVRVGPDGRAYGRDRLEPLLWYGSKHLLEDRPRDRLLALLDEFLTGHGERLINDPLKRAVLQRDLWLAFNWVDIPHGNFADPQLTEEAWRASRQRLRGPLAVAVRRLAHRPPQAADLPDNYA